jgi:hypothetical protein
LVLNVSTGTISGTPFTTGTFHFTVKAANTAGSHTRNLSIITAEAPNITTASLPGGIVRTTYSQRLAATGSAPISWSITSGSLPNGLALNASAGTISGTPSTAGTFYFMVKATNAAGSNGRSLSIVIK